MEKIVESVGQSTVELFGNFKTWAVILILGIGTFFIRFGFLGLLGNVGKKRDVSKFTKNFLLYLPAAAFAALGAPHIFLPGLSRMQNGGDIFLPQQFVFKYWGFFEFTKPYLQPIFLALVSEEVIASLAATIVFLLFRSITLTIAMGMFVFWYIQRF